MTGTTLTRALDLVHTADVRLPILRVAASLGAAYALAGRTAEALQRLDQAVEQTRTMRFIADQALRVTWLSEAYLLAGRLDDAYTQAHRALECARAHQERGHEAYGLRRLGELMQRRDPLPVEQAETYYRQACALAEELGMRPLVAHCHLSQVVLHLRRPQSRRVRSNGYWRNVEDALPHTHAGLRGQDV